MPKKPFVDFREVRSRITMEMVLEHYGVLDTFKRTGTRLSGPCPIHGGSNPTQFRVDTEKNLWNCFSECKHGGNVLDFIAKKEDVSIHDAATTPYLRLTSTMRKPKRGRGWRAFISFGCSMLNVECFFCSQTKKPQADWLGA